MRAKCGDGIGAAPEQRQRRGDHSRAQHAENRQEHFRRCSAIGCRRWRRLQCPCGASGRRCAATMRSASRVGEAPRRAVGERRRLGASASASLSGCFERDAAEHLVDGDAALALRRLREAVAGSPSIIAAPLSVDATRFPANSRTARSRRVLDIGPARHPLLGKIKQRHDVAAGNQHPVERPHRIDEIGAARAPAGAPRSWRRPRGCARPCSCAIPCSSAAAEPK